MLGFRQRLQRGGRAAVGVAFGTEATAAVRLVPGDRDRSPRLLACDRLPAMARPRALADWVAHCGAARARAVGVLARGEYQLLSIEAPPVEPAELRQAVGWQIRERIDFPLDEAVIDTFDPPESARRGRRNIHVIVARRATVMARVQQLTDAGLTVAAIDIPELAQCEVSCRLGLSGGHALLALNPNAGLLTIFRDGEHYLGRPLDIGRAALTARGPSASAELVLEVQRSLDYFESALSQPPLSTLLLFGCGEADAALQQAATEQFRGITCRSITFGDIVAHELEPAGAGGQRAQESHTRELHALGAALRASGPALGMAA